ncbi:hypothetical protein [Streptomyces sp. NPDC056987]|uniref:hypothetical protein n=1 Tax=Streptomyces sp. NPDC056987 TaxID=3345988 RepID=UPI003625DD8A
MVVGEGLGQLGVHQSYLLGERLQSGGDVRELLVLVGVGDDQLKVLVDDAHVQLALQNRGVAPVVLREDEENPS